MRRSCGGASRQANRRRTGAITRRCHTAQKKLLWLLRSLSLIPAHSKFAGTHTNESHLTFTRNNWELSHFVCFRLGLMKSSGGTFASDPNVIGHHQVTWKKSGRAKKDFYSNLNFSSVQRSLPFFFLFWQSRRLPDVLAVKLQLGARMQMSSARPPAACCFQSGFQDRDQQHCVQTDPD